MTVCKSKGRKIVQMHVCVSACVQEDIIKCPFIKHLGRIALAVIIKPNGWARTYIVLISLREYRFVQWEKVRGKRKGGFRLPPPTLSFENETFSRGNKIVASFWLGVLNLPRWVWREEFCHFLGYHNVEKLCVCVCVCWNSGRKGILSEARGGYRLFSKTR